MASTLEYTAKWYNIGDPDVPWIAVAYGAIAATTIWLIEHILQRLLYSDAIGISVSDAAALVVYCGSGPLQLASWIFGRKDRLGRRASIALLMRILLVAVDVLILFLSIPRSIPVFESDVMSTQLSFSEASAVTTDVINSGSVRTCRPDVAQYRGFSPSALRQICYGGFYFYDAPLERNFSKNNTLVYLFSYNENLRLLSIIGVHNRIGYTLSLTLTTEYRGAVTTFHLECPKDIGVQAAYALKDFANKKGNADSCEVTFQTDTLAILECQRDSLYKFDNKTFDFHILELYNMVGIQVINPRLNKTINGTVSVLANPHIGSINRPRLPILPALILLFALLVFHGVLRLVCKGQNIELKLWSNLYKNVHGRKSENPFESSTLELISDSEPDDEKLSKYPNPRIDE